EVLDLAGDLRRKVRGIEARDPRDARLAGEDRGPGVGDADADGRDDAEAGDGDASTCSHGRIAMDGLWNAGNEHGAARPRRPLLIRAGEALLLVVGFDVVDRLLDRGDLLGF